MSESVVNFNPHLRPWQAPQPNNVAGKGVIEEPGRAWTMVWQTRRAEPTQYENDLGDALEKVFGAGALEPGEVADGLNGLGFRMRTGGPWTGETLAAELRALAG
jgi:hypothetical protein